MQSSATHFWLPKPYTLRRVRITRPKACMHDIDNGSIRFTQNPNNKSATNYGFGWRDEAMYSKPHCISLIVSKPICWVARFDQNIGPHDVIIMGNEMSVFVCESCRVVTRVMWIEQQSSHMVFKCDLNIHRHTMDAFLCGGLWTAEVCDSELNRVRTANTSAHATWAITI